LQWAVTAIGHSFTDMKFNGANVPVGQDFKVEAIADFGGDGRSDILWRNTAGNIAVWEMNGSLIANPNWVKNSQTGAELVIPRADWAVVGAEYLGNDHRADILWRNKWDGKWAIWEMNSGVLQTGSNLKVGDPWQDLSKTPAGMAGRPAAIDEAGNTTATAFNMGTLTAQASFQGAVDAWDTSDVYRFEVSGTQMLSVKLDGAMRLTNQDVNLVLLGSDGAVLRESKNVGAQIDLIQASLEAGTYYVQVSAAGARDYNSYQLSLGVGALTATLGFSTAMDDTGISQTDMITKNNQPWVRGTGPAGSVLRLYGQAVGGSTTTVQPEVLLGSVTVGSDGNWKIQSPELADGDYTLSARIVLLNGKEQRIAQNWSAKIDTKAPKLQIDGIYDGIAYVDGEAFTGTVRDLDGQDLRAKYTFTRTTKTLAVSEGQLNGNIDMKNVGNFEEKTITFEAEDRAGNITTLDYRAMKLPLDDLTEEGFGLQGMPDGSADSRTLPTGTIGFNPMGAGGRIYIGQGGVWGFGSGSGSGSSWNPSSPIGSGSDPTLPASDPALNLDQQLDYLTALREILTTARDVLSNHKQTVVKKEALRRELEMLMAVGSVVKDKGLYAPMAAVFHGAFSNAFGNITRRNAISKGWDLAKKLAISIQPTGLQIFQANVFATSLVAMKENNQTIDEGDLLKATDSLAKTYARLNPIEVSFYSRDRGSSFLAHLFMDGKWATFDRDKGKSAVDAEKNGVKASVDYLVKEMQGQADGVKSLELIDRTLQAAMRVSQLHQDYYYQTRLETSNGADTRVSERVTSSIHESAFLSKLTDFGFEIARTNSATTELRGNQSSEWIETLVEGKNPGQWTGKHVNLAAAGMSEWFGGFSLPKTSPGYWSSDLRGQAKGALEYAERLVMAARAIDDVNLVTEVKNADFLSHLVNLAGAYAALNPNSMTLESSNMFLELSRQNSSVESIKSTANLLKNWLADSLSARDQVSQATSLLRIDRNDILDQIEKRAFVDSMLTSSKSAYNPAYLYLLTNMRNPVIFAINDGSFTRNLYAEEIKILKDFFGEWVDYQPVELVLDHVITRQTNRAFTFGNQIAMSKTYLRANVFHPGSKQITREGGLPLLLHEMTHIWQYQNGGWGYAVAALAAQKHAEITTGSDNEAYNWRNVLNSKTKWSKWNPEQQAQGLEVYADINLKYRANPNSVSEEEIQIMRQLSRYVGQIKYGIGAAY
jgi:Bacterial Ig-like domain/Bacterial pre-peptidase C-terminal domain